MQQSNLNNETILNNMGMTRICCRRLFITFCFDDYSLVVNDEMGRVLESNPYLNIQRKLQKKRIIKAR